MLNYLDCLDVYCDLVEPLLRPNHGFNSILQLCKRTRIGDDLARRTIAKLEERIGSPLLAVEKHRQVLTPDGRKLYKIAQELRSLADNSEDGAAEILCVEMDQVISEAVLPQVLPGFLEVCGAVRLRIYGLDFGAVKANIANSRTAFGVGLFEEGEECDLLLMSIDTALYYEEIKTLSRGGLPMSATLIDRQENTLTIQLRIPLTRSLFETEQTILQTLNQAGTLATTEALKQFDTDGSPIQIGQNRYTTKGQEPKTYQTPYGEAIVERHVYQTAQGGPTFCPLERDARIILTATPRFAQQVSHKYAEMAGARVVRDLEANHARQTSLNVIQRLAEVVGSAAQAKEEQWHYATPELEAPVRTISVGLDGTCLLLVDDGHRQAMVGTVSLYDRDGERLHTIYVAATPEYGKESFYQRLGREIEHAQQLYPRAQLTGVADGSSDNWEFLGQYTEDSCVDFYHATAYLQGAARVAHPRSFSEREQWLDERCHRLKHGVGAAKEILAELQGFSSQELSESAGESLDKAITYFTNQQARMDYARREQACLPIGSGVTESACKTIVKMRLCRSGAKWKEQGAGIVLSLRTLSYTEGRWEQFWAKIDRYGFPVED